MAEQYRSVPIGRITKSQLALRAVDTESENFLNLVDSVRAQGVLQALIVRPVAPGSSLGDYDYVLIDGLHRYTAAEAAGLAEVPVRVLDIDDVGALKVQFTTNNQHIETKRIEYARALLRFMNYDEKLTKKELAAMINRSTQYVDQILGLLNLPESIQTLIDNGDIVMANAVQLSKLKNREDAIEYADKAMALDTVEFAEMVKTRNEEVIKAAREGRAAAPNVFVAVAHLRKTSELKEEMEKSLIGPALIADSGISTAEEGFALCLKWVMNLDAPTVAAAKAKYEAMEAAKEEKRKAAQAKREAAKAAKAAEAGAAVADAEAGEAPVEAVI